VNKVFEFSEESNMWEEIFEQLDFFSSIVDSEFNIIRINKKMKDFFGDVVGKKCYEVFHSLDAPPEFCVVLKLLRGEDGIEEFYEPSLKRYFRVKASKVKLNDTTLFVHFVEDISEGKRLEEKLKVEKEFIESIIKAANSLIIGLDEEGRIVLFNKKCEELTGWNREDAIGKSWFNNFIPQNAKEEAEKAFQKAKQGELAECRIPIISKDGERLIWWHSTTVKKNEKWLTVCIGIDITEEEKSKKKVEELIDVLRLINKVTRHDILNNLMIIGGAVDAYLVKRDDKVFDFVFKAIDKSTELINEMKNLEFLVSRGEELKPYNIREIIESVVENYSSSVDFEIEGDCTVIADEALKSVIDNIVRNAIIHSETNRIDFKIENKNDFCEIRITDYGIGIPDEIKPKIFEEGFKYGKTGHSGLGLYIVKKVIDRCGGSIRVEDNDPRGTIFVVTLRRVGCG
jgi:PAS domain S-box-containing protein